MTRFGGWEGGGGYTGSPDGEYHLFNPDTVYRLQHSTRAGRYDVFKQYTADVDDQSKRLATLRGLFELRTDVRPAISIDDVEPVSEIVPLTAAPAAKAPAIRQRTTESALANTQSIIAFGSGALSEVQANSPATLALVRNRVGGPAAHPRPRMVATVTRVGRGG